MFMKMIGSDLAKKHGVGKRKCFLFKAKSILDFNNEDFELNRNNVHPAIKDKIGI